MATQDRKRVVAAQTGIYLLVVIAIGVMVNVLSYGWFQRFDWTRTQRFTLSQGSGRLVKSLSSPIQADVYVTKGLAQLDVFVDDLTDLLKEYERAGEGKFKFTIIEASDEPTRKEAEAAGLQPMAFGQEGAADESGKLELTQGYMGLVLKYGSEKVVIPQLQPGQSVGLEFWITNKIREIRDKADSIKHRIAVVTGKDELKLTDTNLVARQGRGGAPSIKGILDQAFPFYAIEELDLGGGENEIDPAIEGLIITQPRKDYTEKELRRIDEFLMRGKKSLVVYVSAVTLAPNDANMEAELKLWGLEPLLEGYGLKIDKNAVFDFGGHFEVQVMTGFGRPQVIPDPAIAIAQDDPRFAENERRLDTSFPPFFRMDQLVFPYPSSIELLRDKQPADVKLYPVARTTKNTGVLTTDKADMKPKADWRIPSTEEQRVIAAVAEGKLKSAFGKVADGIKPNPVAPEPSRVLVIASSQFLTNPFAYSGNGPELGGQFQMFGGAGGDKNLQMLSDPYARGFLTATILSLKNTLDWMSGDSDLLAVSAKLLGETNLTYATLEKPKATAQDDEESLRKKDEEYRKARQRVQANVQWSLTLGLPALFALIGVGRWQWRQAKRNQKRI
jgi:ABC-type uncharacterized transport system involved in gliding motility auxiliary subunit